MSRMSASLLIVEDEEPIKVLLTYNFEAEGYRVRATALGEEVAMMIADERPNLIILDWMLPGISGIEVCRILRSKPETRGIPIIMLTARGEEAERVRGLATGADDYVVKPFSVPELLARVRSILRRADPDAVAEVLAIGDLSLDRKMRRLTRANRDINLSPTEFRLLEHLMQSPGRVYTRAQLLDAVWGRDIYIDERTVDVHVGRLRKSLTRGRENDPIRTVRGMGYSFDERFGSTEIEKGAGERLHTPVRGADR
jgi:two-component system phosphate regulon response regulator PhoB